MTENIQKKLLFLKSGEYKNQRRTLADPQITFSPDTEQITVHKMLLSYMLNSEEPRLFEDDIFGFNRTIKSTPIGICGEERFKNAPGNIVPNYDYVLSHGMDAVAECIKSKLEEVFEDDKRLLYEAMLSCIESSLDIADRYREHAIEKGAGRLYGALSSVPHGPANSFYEACVFLKFIHFTLRCNRNTHIPFGRFDQYMFPYFQRDLEKGVSEEELFEILEDFFISMNFDADTYTGMQLGDNGMSMVLGGRDINSNDEYNKLSEMCMKASLELCLIDPKINLRVDKNTPVERLEFATLLTKKGLGFPQYCNDDVVIPGLIKLGYAPEDACNYAVAACWEYIIPGKAYDIPNIDVVNFPKAVSKAVNDHLKSCDSFESFLGKLKECVEEECSSVAQRIKNLKSIPSPYLSVFVEGCIEKGLDISEGGAIYNNYGVHGVGIAPAADAIAAVKKAVFDDKKYSSEELIKAINDNFENHSELRNYLLSCPKMGNNLDSVDAWGTFIMDIFTDVFSKHKNLWGGVLRPGTGSALEYIHSAACVGATADGRYAYTPFGSSFSPSPIARLEGPLSCIQSFTKYDLTKIINGGPLTLEIHDTTFRNDDGIKKVAMLVKAFIDLGGHQLQLNAINRECLLDAQKNPEAHKNLIVRVWGWSGYFNELDLSYQNHIISRTEFLV